MNEKDIYINKDIKRALLEAQKSQIIYTGAKVGSQFNIKDMTKREHKHDLVYSVKCPEEKNSEEVYNDEISRMFSERFE